MLLITESGDIVLWNSHTHMIKFINYHSPLNLSLYFALTQSKLMCSIIHNPTWQAKMLCYPLAVSTWVHCPWSHERGERVAIHLPKIYNLHRLSMLLAFSPTWHEIKPSLSLELRVFIAEGGVVVESIARLCMFFKRVNCRKPFVLLVFCRILSVLLKQVEIPHGLSNFPRKNSCTVIIFW